jgi:hypothetical protein
MFNGFHTRTREVPLNSTAPRLHAQPPVDKAEDWADLPAAWRLRLGGHGIHNPSDWRQLTRSQRDRLFGVTRAMVATIDAIARGAR